MTKAHENINWENYPSGNTPINEENLNNMDTSIDTIDDRVIHMDTSKADKTEIQRVFVDVELDEYTGIFTFTRFNGAKVQLDTLLEKIIVNFDFNEETQKLILYLKDGTVKEIDLSVFITQYEFVDSEEIYWVITPDNKVKASIKNGSITEKHLKPDYLADIKLESAKAESGANAAKNYATEAESWTHGGTGTREEENLDNAKEYARQAKESAEQAKEVSGGDFIRISEKGKAGGVASLDKNANIPKEQIPDMYSSKEIYGDTTVSMGRKIGSTVGNKSFAFGNNAEASGYCSFAFGDGVKASGEKSIAIGYDNDGILQASGRGSVALGGSNIASGANSFACGRYSEASGYISCAIGESAFSLEDYSFTEGAYTKASGIASHSGGYTTIASNYASYACGKHNKEMITGGSFDNQLGDVFVIGNGTSLNEKSNALRVTYLGDIYGTKAFQSSGADYAEFIKPWEDGNPYGEDRVGYFVTVKNGFLYKAEEGDYIAGITSGNPSIVGNSDEDYYWRYERDEFNRIVMEDVPEAMQQTNAEGNLLFDGETHKPSMVTTGNIIPNARMKLSDAYDPSLQKSYVERKDRKEWDYVGMLGVLPVRDDGTCIPGNFCKCGDNGVATFTDERGFDKFYVIERISDNVVSVIMK